MPALAFDLRKSLETAVVKARELAERGAREALAALDVGGNSHIPSMTAEQERLRRRLRAHGRQLGDQAGANKGSQGIERLVREMAYEHWHRMLFARFLAQNQLLIEPSSGVAVSLAEVEELAAEEGTDLWELAASYAQGMLPEIFRTDDPVLALRLPLEIRQQLQALVAGLDAEVFTASDSLGWTYQFWQTKRKKEVNDSGVKIGADELSPVTQLFTESYMVDFLLDNTLGAWHAGKMLAANPELASTAETEDDLRQAVALPGCPWTYLRFIQADNGPWSPASGAFEDWPESAAELKCLDPCMGSGHFVVAMFERLVALRIAQGGLSEQEAVAKVIRENLFGLEIDPRCTQIAAFNLALAAWRRVGHRRLPAMNLACSGLAPNASEAEWLTLAGENERFMNGMERLYRLFDKAAVLGSLINPLADEANLLMAGFNELQPLLEQALAKESKDDSSHELAVTARGLAMAANILARQFTLVATNVPYLGAGKQNDDLQKYCARFYSMAKADLSTCFVERCVEFAAQFGTASLVTPQNWLFLTSYKRLREKLLASVSWNSIVNLGSNAFQEMNWWAATTGLVILNGKRPSVTHRLTGYDTSALKDHALKALYLSGAPIDLAAHSSHDGFSLERPAGPLLLSQSRQKENPDSRLVVGELIAGSLLEDFATSHEGLTTGDLDKFVLKFWEAEFNATWKPYIQHAGTTHPYSGRTDAIRWGYDGEIVRNSPTSYVKGKEAWGRTGIRITQMRSLPATFYTGEIFGKSAATILPLDPAHLMAIWCFCSSAEFSQLVRTIDQKVNVTIGTLVKVPFDLSEWQSKAAVLYPYGIPDPFSSHPTQWLFDGSPKGADHPLHVAVARLLGYRWPRQNGTSFPDCPTLDPDGLEALGDEDGIVCLAPVRGETSAVERLRKLIATALGDEWTVAREHELLLATAFDNKAKKADPDLDAWLRSSFFSEHCKLFHSRPFIWQIWDGNPNGFSALVNYHKLAAPNGQGRKTLELLTFTYLGDWIDRQKLDQAEGINGADDRLAAALDLQSQLKKILEGEPPYDIFVRWKHLHQQAIGWDPDINDGVRLNIRPFLNAQLRKGGKAGAGILRAKPGTVKWSKDRGKEPMRSKDKFPWFWGWAENSPAIATDFGAPVPNAPPPGDTFDGNRWNDLHYTRAAKAAARARYTGGQS